MAGDEALDVSDDSVEKGSSTLVTVLGRLRTGKSVGAASAHAETQSGCIGQNF